MGVKIIAGVPVCPGLKTVLKRQGPQPQKEGVLHGVLEIKNNV